jgi:outer membrane protein assembly factor BamD
MNKRSFFPSVRAGSLAGLAIASLMVSSLGAIAQVTGSSQATTDANGKQQETVTLSASPNNKKGEKVVQSKDTKKELAKEKKMAPVDAGLPDKVLYDKALDATKRGHFDVARLDLQTLLNTYPDSQYQMKAKLAIADSWYKEGGTAALTQAEQEYKDFITFFPNAPEAAEAQMRVGDIYFKQMDKPDRDYSKATHAQEEYRLMLQQFPESTLVPQAKQRLREVQEVMATREAAIAAFYAAHSSNWPAAIARYQTVVDTYPQYSHMDEVLIGLGDAYETEAKYVRTMKLPEAAKASLVKTYDDQAIAAYSKVVLEHSAAPHAEDARDRLDAMNVPIPTPTPEQVASSVALENSRRQYHLQDRATLLIMHKPDVVLAARDGDPTLADPAPTLAPHVVNKITADFNSALSPDAAHAEAPAAAAAPGTDGSAATPATAAAPAPPAAPLQFQDVPAAGAAGAPSGTSAVTSEPGMTTAAPAATGNTMGVEILTPGANAGTNGKPADDNGGLKPVGPVNATPLPAAEKPAEAPNAVNDISSKPQPAAQAADPNKKKNPKPEFDKGDESSSKHKKKKGLSKINPF